MRLIKLALKEMKEGGGEMKLIGYICKINCFLKLHVMESKLTFLIMLKFKVQKRLVNPYFVRQLLS